MFLSYAVTSSILDQDWHDEWNDVSGNGFATEIGENAKLDEEPLCNRQLVLASIELYFRYLEGLRNINS